MSASPAHTTDVALDKASILARLPELCERIGKDSARRDRDRELPYSAFDLVRAARIGTLRVPVRYGGPGATLAELIEVVVKLASAESNVAHALRSHFNFTETLFLGADSAALRNRTTSVLKGELYGGASTEVGTPRPGDITARIARTTDGLRLNGRKFYATGTAFCDFVSTSALDDAGELVRLIIPTDRVGVAVLDDWDGMGQRLTASGGISFTDVAVNEDEIVASTRNGLAGRHASTLRQLFLAACVGGIVRNVLSDAVSYARAQARPITHSPAASASEDWFVQREIGRIAAISQAIDTLIADAAQRLDRGYAAILHQADDVEAVVTANAVATANMQGVIGPLALEAAQAIFNVGGASATSRSRNFDRHWRNVRTILSHNPLAHKERVVGDEVLNGTPVPIDGGFF